MNRLEAFSDGVFAIAITLLVLELAVPIAGEQGLLSALHEERLSYLAYLVSFATIGAFWLAHSSITEYVTSADPVFLRLNLAFLLVVSFLPYPTKVLAEFAREDETERVAATFFGATVLIGLVLLVGLWRYAMSAGLAQLDGGEGDARLLLRRVIPAGAAYLLLIFIGFPSPTVAVVGYLAVAIFLILPFGAILPHRRASGDVKPDLA
jgi:uncharacterized membrane protein